MQHSFTGRTLLKALSERGLRGLCKLLSEHFTEKNISLTIAKHVKLNQVASFYMLDPPASSFGWMLFRDAVFAKDWDINLKQRDVASKTFYKAVHGRIDTVMVQNEKNVSVKRETVNF